jgi:uncharacterized DUF497 family protein
MKPFVWNEEKNVWLKQERGLCFEDIVIAVGEKRTLEILEHTNKKKYPNQKILIVSIDKYAYLIPFVETENAVFLKTIIPNRKATKQYLIDKKPNTKK